jgi:hypothetical protein
MEEPEVFSIKVESDGDRFRWSTHINGQVRDRSEETFATRGDAALAAVGALKKRCLELAAKSESLPEM